MTKILVVLAALTVGMIVGYGSALLYSASANPPAPTSYRSGHVAVVASSRMVPVPSTRPVVHIREVPVPQIKPIELPVPVAVPIPKPKVVACGAGQLQDDFTQARGKNIDASIRAGRFWAYEDGKLIHEGLISAGLGPIVPVGERGDQPHNHCGTWYVFKKEVLHHSRAYDCDMRNCLFYCDGHAFHACQWSDVGKLGSRASHGCIRLHPNMAKTLYAWADLSTRVRVRE